MNAKENIKILGTIVTLTGLACLAFGATQLRSLDNKILLGFLGDKHLKLRKHVTIPDGDGKNTVEVGMFSSTGIYQKTVGVSDTTTGDSNASKTEITGQNGGKVFSKTLTKRNKTETLFENEILAKYIPRKNNHHTKTLKT